MVHHSSIIDPVMEITPEFVMKVIAGDLHDYAKRLAK